MADGGGRVGGHGPGMVPVHPAQNEHHRPAGWRHDEAMRPPQLPQRAISCHQPRGRHQPIIRFPANCRAATFSSSLEKAGRPGETPCLSPPARNDRQSLRRRLCRGRCVVACRRPRLPVGLPGLPAANHHWLVMSISHPGLQRQIIFISKCQLICLLAAPGFTDCSRARRQSSVVRTPSMLVSADGPARRLTHRLGKF